MTRVGYFALMELMKINKQYRSGQVGLLLLVVVGLVIGLVMSVASRSLSDTVLTRKESENTSAFAVAESGVELALSELAQGGGSPAWTAVSLTDPTGLYSAEYAVDELSSFEMMVKEGEGVEVEISSPAISNLTIYWTRDSSSYENPACSGVEGSGMLPSALGVTVIGSTLRRDYYNAYNCSISANGFADASASSEASYRSMVVVNKQAGDISLRLTPIYNDATIKIVGTGLTEAMFRVASVGSGGDSQKEIQVKRSRDAAGSVFDFAVFSGSTIVHN